MRSILLQTIGVVMSRHDISHTVQNEIIRELSKKHGTGKHTTAKEAEWDKLLLPLKVERRRMTTNLHNRSTGQRHIYAEYIELLKEVEKRIEIAQTHHKTVAEATQAAAEQNEARITQGKRPLAECGDTWQSWVPPHVKQEFAAKVTKSYDDAGYHSGNRFVPFIPAATRKEAVQRSKNLRGTFERIRTVCETSPGTNAGATPYRALQLAAVRMAEISLDKLLKSYELGSANPVDTPVPVNWLALLDAPMRRRLADAQANPAAVTTDGLTQFYDPAPEHVQEDFNAWDTEGLAKQENDDAVDVD